MESLMNVIKEDTPQDHSIQDSPSSSLVFSNDAASEVLPSRQAHVHIARIATR